jgi:hypothetical protein
MDMTDAISAYSIAVVALSSRKNRIAPFEKRGRCVCIVISHRPLACMASNSGGIG